jgi:hypothetical protein
MTSDDNLTSQTLCEVRFISTGARFINGVSNQYDTSYDLQLVGIIGEDEFATIVGRLNRTLQELWPCHVAYYVGYICIPCTFGISLFCPLLCVTEAEKHANNMLRQLSLKAKYYDRGISFKLVKGFCRSDFIISFPVGLTQSDEQRDIEQSLPRVKSLMSGGVNLSEPTSTFSIFRGSHKSRLKDV